MKLRMIIKMDLVGIRPGEEAEAERAIAMLDGLGLREGVKDKATLDESLFADVARVLGDLKQILNRARARKIRRRRPRGGE